MTLIAGHALPVYAFVIALVLTTILVAFPGSLIPSAYAQLAGEKIGLALLPLIRVLGIILTPISMACQAVLNVILKPFGIAPLRFKPISLRSEVEQCVGGIEKSGALTDEEKTMIRRIFSFGELGARDLMTPRVAMRCLSESDTLGQAAAVIGAEHYSRLPVFRGSPDSIVGVFYAKDLLDRWGQEGAAEMKVGELMREPLFAPETITARTLLADMRKKQIHAAILVDEYGSATGLVTIEDILEAIHGELRDEYDEVEPPLYQEVSSGVYRVDARLPVKDARDELGFKIPNRYGYDTLAGFVCAVAGRVPAVGEVIEWRGHSFKVIDATTTGVRTLEVKVAQK
jgi:CBS domain containing-hemolysin-like protein